MPSRKKSHRINLTALDNKSIEGLTSDKMPYHEPVDTGMEVPKDPQEKRAWILDPFIKRYGVHCSVIDPVNHVSFNDQRIREVLRNKSKRPEACVLDNDECFKGIVSYLPPGNAASPAKTTPCEAKESLSNWAGRRALAYQLAPRRLLNALRLITLFETDFFSFLSRPEKRLIHQNICSPYMGPA
jgi:hypothetical protein